MIVVSFHSYKGGSGCTTTVINTLPFLIKELEVDSKHPILVVDGDLDSAGLTYLLGADEHFENAYDAKAMLGGSLPGKNTRDSIENHPFFSKCLKVGDKFGGEVGSVYFLGIDDNRTFDTIDMVGGADKTMYELRRLCNQLDFKAIIFDTAAGDQFSAVLTNRLSQVIVSCLRPTKQSRMGTKRYLERLTPMMIDSSNGEQLRRIIVVPISVPQEESFIKGKDQFSQTLQLIRETVKDFDYEINRDFLKDEQFGIPEIERFKWQEDILFNIQDELDEEDKQSLAIFNSLAQTIVKEGHNE
jgi:cellulose biosynthesis protein BcsQ